MKPGMYRNEAGELHFWTGYSWDPRAAATIWTRVWCFLIDMVLFSLILFPVLFGVGFLIGSLDPGQEGAPTGLGWLLAAAIFMLYFSISYAAAGRTLGMALGRIEVVYLPTGGTRPSISTAVLRSMVLGLGGFIPFGAIIWLGLTAGSKTRQGPHDKAAYTAVLRKVRTRTEPTTQIPPLAAQPLPGYGPRPDTPPAFDPSAAAVVGGPGEFAPPAKRSRRKWVIALVSVLVVAVAIVSAVLIDSRIKKSETLELLATVEQAQSTWTTYNFDSRIDLLLDEYEATSDRCGRTDDPQPCDDVAYGELINGLNDVALEYIPQIQRDVLDVESVSTLPWHGDVRTAQDASLDYLDLALESVKRVASLDPSNETSDWGKFGPEMSSTYVIAKRRFIEIKFVPPGPQDVQEAIDRVFTN